MHTEQNAPHNHITLCDVPPTSHEIIHAYLSQITPYPRHPIWGAQIKNQKSKIHASLKIEFQIRSVL